MSMNQAGRRTLAVAVSSHDNGFNLVRLVAALLVVVFHCFQLAPDRRFGADPATALMAPVADLGALAVGVFFMVSGIFITQSWMRDPHLLRFALRRVARIVPGVLVCSLLTVALGFAFFSDAGWRGLFSLPAWEYILGNAGLHGLQYVIPPEQLRIPGVLSGQDLNGPLWTLYWEGRMYVMVALVGMAAFLPLRTWFKFAALFLLLAATLFPEVVGGYVWEVRMWSLFLVGMLLLTLAEQVRFGPRQLVCALLLLGLNWTRNAALTPSALSFFGIALVAASAAMWTGSTRLRGMAHIQRHDYSYGIYIYHWPVILMLRAALPPLAAPALLGVVLLVLVPLAMLSWHWVEAPMLALARRKLVRRKTSSAQFEQAV